MKIALACSVPMTLGVLFVHGIGMQSRGSTLTAFGDPLLAWLRAWSQARGGALTVSTMNNEPSSPRQVTATWEEPGREPVTLVLAESWWAESFAAPSLHEVLLWSPRVAYRLIWRNAPLPAAFFAGITFLAWFLYPPALAYVALAALAVTVLLIAVPVLALLAYAAIRLFPQARALRAPLSAWIVGAVGDAHALTRSETRFAAMRAQVAADLAWINERVDRTVVLAHSQGAVVAVETMAARPDLRVDTLLTVGSALRLLRLPGDDSVVRFREAHPAARWFNFTSQIDPVSAGPIDKHGLYPVEIITQNGGSALAAHTSYPKNAEGFQTAVVACLAATTAENVVWSETDEAHVAQALTNREARCAIRAFGRLFSLAGVIGGAVLLDRGGLLAAVSGWLDAAFLVPAWAADAFADAVDSAPHRQFTSALVSGVLVLLYGAIVVLPAHNAWHRRGARDLAQGCPARPARGGIPYFISLAPLAGVTIAMGITIQAGSDFWGTMAAVLPGIFLIGLYMMAVAGGREFVTSADRRISGLLHPLYPAFANKLPGAAKLEKRLAEERRAEFAGSAMREIGARLPPEAEVDGATILWRDRVVRVNAAHVHDEEQGDAPAVWFDGPAFLATSRPPEFWVAVICAEDPAGCTADEATDDLRGFVVPDELLRDWASSPFGVMVTLEKLRASVGPGLPIDDLVGRITSILADTDTTE